ncbi:glycoside hydrolase family 3 C-terminal domain-containing protein [Micromonospora sp. SL1-18]|uniref:glycoside hydrolase family 3 C-terminal domain-containing protein n=1 Tax=Micromonospora sp. SL1-18 TaxID=3399128 RepID=UPI003A4DA3E7
MRRTRLLHGALGVILAATATATAGTPSQAAAADELPWMNTPLTPETRAHLLVSAMTLDQKIAQLHGQSGSIPELPECGNGGRHVPGIPELAIPTFRVTNGPVGVGAGDCSPQDRATALPVGLGLAASFDTSLAYQFGDLIGGETRTLGVHELEGPGMNLARVGQGGRNFEYLGEDPMLAGTLAASEIKGIQSNDVIAMAKHYVLNDQEQNRNGGDIVVDDRVLHELYLTPYEMSVKDGGVGSIMCSYNRIGRTYACDNPYTLSTVLRDQWGFKGYVQSDFGATHSTAQSLNAGQDFEMSGAVWYTPDRIKAALADGSLSMDTIDRALERRYVQMFKYGIFDRPITRGTIDAETNGATARSIGEQTAVLLKNDGSLLPLDASRIHSIALIGQQTFAGAAVAGGGGSSRVAPIYTVSPLQGLQNVLGQLGSSATVRQVIVANNNSNIAEATAAAASADVVILMAGVVTSEGSDRPGLSLPNNQDALISAVAAANPRTALVLKDGDPVLMPWIDQVPAVLEAWNPGEEDGNIVARLLFGLANPSGKLPVTYPRRAEDTPTSTAERYPGVTVNGIPTASYSEGLEMGYRWYDANDIAPLFPFGYGLSYTTFAFDNLTVTPQLGLRGQVTVGVDVTNTGARAGAEVAQVYLSYPQQAGEPPIQLKRFQKVALEPGQTRHLTFHLDQRAFSIWHTDAQAWTTVKGSYTVRVGDSSANLPLQAPVDVDQTEGVQYVAVDAPQVFAPDSAQTVTTTFTNTGDYPAARVRVSLPVPDGWTAQPLGPSTWNVVQPRSSVSTRWRVTAAADAAPGSVTLSATARFAGMGGNQTATRAANVAVPYPALAAAYDNTGITDDAAPLAGAFASSGRTYSAQALAAAGLRSGGTVNHAGSTFTWPNVPPGTPDNAEANGQVIALSGTGDRLAFLGASTNGSQGGTGTIYYADGRSQQFTVSLPDWWGPPGDTEVVASMPYQNQTNPPGQLKHVAYVYYASVPIRSGVAVRAVALPVTGVSPGPGMHVFAMTVN